MAYNPLQEDDIIHKCVQVSPLGHHGRCILNCFSYGSVSVSVTVSASVLGSGSASAQLLLQLQLAPHHQQRQQAACRQSISVFQRALCIIKT